MVALGGMTMQTIIATNTNVGLAMELRKANPTDSRVADVLKQTVLGVNTCVQQLENYRREVRFADPNDAALMVEFISNLKSIAIQAESYLKWMSDPDPVQKELFTTHRKKVTEFILKQSQ